MIMLPYYYVIIQEKLFCLKSLGRLGLGFVHEECLQKINGIIYMISYYYYQKGKISFFYILRLVYRQLKLQRTDEIIDKVEDFVKNVLGNKYGVSPGKLLVKKASPNSIPDEGRSFFCSELIAAAYKKIGLLPKEIASSYYWPGNFSSCKKLKLQGAQLSNEYLIDFQM